ncbi:MAG: Lipoteichoic acid synthase [Candidatus Izimaplasma bacterium HR2]|nr:MAG: Lipoteichoic acid synthase [Candidatus Izimaplasma bacterium HR2]
MYDKEQFVTKFSTVNLLFRDLKVIITPSFSINRDIEYIEDYYDNNVKLHPDNEYTDIFEGKNLIFIIGESFDSIAVSEELTPNIYKLKTEGLDFVNHFTPVFPRTTCDSEIIFNTSIIPSITDGPTCYVYNENSYSESIAELFNNSGYITTGLHNNYKEFYTRDLVYEGFGYDYFYGQNEIPLTDTEIRYDSVFGEKTLDYAIFEDELFFSTYLSLSGHSPYEETNLATVEHLDIVNDYYGDTYSDTIKGYIASQIEVDLMVGVIMEDLEAKGILDNTVIVFTNDHYPYALDQEEYENVKGIEEDYEKMRGVLYIWSSDIEHAEVDRLSSSFDFLPTMINMFGLDGNYSSYIGNDIFCLELDPIVYFKDYSIYDGINHYSFSETSDIINTSVIAIAQANYDLSQKLLSVNYYKKE